MGRACITSLGGFISGPIFKNRTFFSAGYDGWRYSQPGLGLAYVPTAAEIAGDFTNTPFRRQIFNPYSTRQVGANVVRDAFRCDAAGNRVSATDSGLTTAYATNDLNEFTAAGPTSYTYDAAGNLRTRTDATGTTSFRYDLQGHLAGIVNPQLQACKYFSSQQFQVFHLIEHRIEQKMLRASAYKLT